MDLDLDPHRSASFFGQQDSDSDPEGKVDLQIKSEEVSYFEVPDVFLRAGRLL